MFFVASVEPIPPISPARSSHVMFSPLPLLIVFLTVAFALWIICRTPYKSDGVPRSRLIYILLALFVGVLGIHNFYAGFKVRGAISIILTMTLVGVIVSAIMALIDIATVTHDAAGVRFKE